MSDLNERQEKFLELMFKPEYADNIEQAKIDAGYSDNTKVWDVVAHLQDEIIKKANHAIAMRIGKSLKKVDDVMNEPAMKGAKAVLEAAWGILDRAGITKKERLEVEHKAASGIFIIPEKKN